MNKTKLITYLRDPNQLTSKGIDGLEDIVNKYPYFLGARLLLAKASHEKKHPKAKKRIASASIYSTDRILFKKYLRGNLFFLEKSTVTSVETTSNTTELSANSAVPENPSNQLDSLLEELQRDMENLKNSRKKFGEIQDKIEEDDAIHAALKKIDTKDNKSLDNVQKETKKNKEKLKRLEITQAIIEKAKSEVQDEDEDNEDEIKKIKKESEVIDNGNKEIDKSEYPKNIPSLTADSKFENKKEEPPFPLREQHDDQLLPKNRETNFFDNFAQEKEVSSKNTKIDDPQKADTHPPFDENIADNPPMLDQNIENTNNTEKKSQVNLINKFIKEPSQMKYQKKEENISDDLAKESSVWDSNVASEYLAEIYITQGNKFRAIKIYEALILKYPEKKSYFADLILKIK